VHRTVTTNGLGTRNVLETAAEAGVPQVVCASTRKALRPYSPDVYTASKRAAEWLVARAAAAGTTRYSAARFIHVADNPIVYRASAAVKQRRGGPAPQPGHRVLRSVRPGVRPAPSRALDDPATAGDVSPLQNAFEAARAVRSSCPMTDSFVLEMASDPEPASTCGALAQTAR
jgi:hypothetical protein